jgi:hypothetical protein
VELKYGVAWCLACQGLVRAEMFSDRAALERAIVVRQRYLRMLNRTTFARRLKRALGIGTKQLQEKRLWRWRELKEARDRLAFLATVKRPAVCLECGSDRLENTERHPGCGGQLQTRLTGFYANFALTEWEYTPEGKLLCERPLD